MTDRSTVGWVALRNPPTFDKRAPHPIRALTARSQFAELQRLAAPSPKSRTPSSTTAKALTVPSAPIHGSFHCCPIKVSTWPAGSTVGWVAHCNPSPCYSRKPCLGTWASIATHLLRLLQPVAHGTVCGTMGCGCRIISTFGSRPNAHLGNIIASPPRGGISGNDRTKQLTDSLVWHDNYTCSC